MKRAKNEARSRSIPALPTPGAATNSRTVSGPDKTPGTLDSITVPVLAPRNPYQLLARQRKAGAHDVDARKRRRVEKTELRRLRDE